MSDIKLSDAYKLEYRQIKQRLLNTAVNFRSNLDTFCYQLENNVLSSTSYINVSEFNFIQRDHERLTVLKDLIETLEKEGL